jgi:hypothetical protein
MTMRELAVVLLAAGVVAIPQAPAVDARSASLADATLLTTIDTGKIKGEPTQLGWSPDASQLYVQTSERGPDGLYVNPRILLVSTASPLPTPANSAPVWAAEYWSWKSGRTGPGVTSPEIQIAMEEKTTSGTESPMGGLAYGGGGVDAVAGTSVSGAARRSEQTQKHRVVKLTLNGQGIGQFVDTPFLPGYSFGWSPKELGLIAYVNDGGRLAVMDMQGHHQELGASKNVILPAWSPDGKRIAYLQKASRNHWDLYAVSVIESRPR